MFGGMRFGSGEVGVKLKADGQIVGQDGELQPGAVGAVVVGRDGVEREFALEFGKRCARRSLGKGNGMT